MDQDISQTTLVVLSLTIFPPFQPEISSIITISKVVMHSPMMEGGWRDLRLDCKITIRMEFNLIIMVVSRAICGVEPRPITMGNSNGTRLVEVHQIPFIVFRIITLAMDISQITWVVPRAIFLAMVGAISQITLVVARAIILADNIFSILLNLFLTILNIKNDLCLKIYEVCEYDIFYS